MVTTKKNPWLQPQIMQKKITKWTSNQQNLAQMEKKKMNKYR